MARHPAPPFDAWAWLQACNETALVNLDPTGWGELMRARRLAALIDVARRDSPLYRRRWGQARTLADLEPVSKQELMQGFDDWATDRDITLQAVSAFVADADAVGDAWLGRYLVWTSSGTSGEPGIFVQDAASLAAYDAIDALRLHGAADVPALWGLGCTFAFVGATGSHFAGIASIERLRRLVCMPWAPRWHVLPVTTPLPELAEALQTLSPQVVVTYPSCAIALAEMQARGDLRLRLQALWLGGEQLSAAQRLTLMRAFACPVRSHYGASECSAMAIECPAGRLHLNHDWVMLETLGRDGRPVPHGDTAHTVALTNLANHAQPLLRYVLSDSVRYLPRACECGSRFPAIEVQGRADDTLKLPAGDGRRAVLLPLALETAIEEGSGVTQFQLVQHADQTTLELRLAQGGADAAATFARAAAALERFLQRQGVTGAHIVRGRNVPRADAHSGKLRRVVAAGSARPGPRT